jgi:hypothetical protein
MIALAVSRLSCPQGDAHPPRMVSLDEALMACNSFIPSCEIHFAVFTAIAAVIPCCKPSVVFTTKFCVVHVCLAFGAIVTRITPRHAIENEKIASQVANCMRGLIRRRLFFLL